MITPAHPTVYRVHGLTAETDFWFYNATAQAPPARQQPEPTEREDGCAPSMTPVVG
jgi:hypothetical protein